LLRAFNRAYAEHRRAAKEAGGGFMTYRVALSRLKRALVPVLSAGRDVDSAHINFKAIFQRGRLRRPRGAKPPPTSWF
jgi:hypothetical protein